MKVYWCLLQVETGVARTNQGVESCVLLSFSYCVYCEAFGTQVFGGGVIRGRIQTKRGQMSWTGHDND